MIVGRLENFRQSFVETIRSLRILARIREKKHIDTALDAEIGAALKAFGGVFREGLK